MLTSYRLVFLLVKEYAIYDKITYTILWHVDPLLGNDRKQLDNGCY
jgi:hypothetical protein